MSTNDQKERSLEAYKIFPYVAWGLTIGFALFVYNITMELKAVTDDLQQQTKELQDRIHQPTHEIEDFGA